MVRAFWLSDLPLLLTVRSLCVPRCPPRLTAGLPGTGQSSQICVMEAVRVKFLIVDLWSEPVGPTALRPVDVPPNIPDVLNVVVVYGCGKGDSLFDCAVLAEDQCFATSLSVFVKSHSRFLDPIKGLLCLLRLLRYLHVGDGPGEHCCVPGLVTDKAQYRIPEVDLELCLQVGGIGIIFFQS